MIAVFTLARADSGVHFDARGISSGNTVALTSHMPSSVSDVPDRTRGVGVIYYDKFMGSLYADERVNLVITTAESKPHNVFIVRTLARDLPARRRRVKEQKPSEVFRSRVGRGPVQYLVPAVLNTTGSRQWSSDQFIRGKMSHTYARSLLICCRRGRGINNKHALFSARNRLGFYCFKFV